MKLLWELFAVFSKIGAFTIGGGYAMLPLIQTEVVDKKGWLSQEEFLDILAIAEVTPGPVAINTSTYVGYKLAGVKGSLIATLGTVIPSFTIILIVARYLWDYRNNPVLDRIFLGIRPAVAALVFSAVYRIGKAMDYSLYAVMWTVITAIGIIVFDINPILIILAAAIISVLIGLYGKKKEA
ncbi:MAG: chromate transporter [Clostridium sp.]|nr:chromate transporter [Clostridium sp.]